MPRFTLRTLFVVVTVAAVVCGTLTIRRFHFLAKAKEHRDHAGNIAIAWRAVPGIPANKETQLSDYDDVIALGMYLRELHSYHESLASAYARAADRPWVPMEAAPPIPEIRFFTSRANRADPDF